MNALRIDHAHSNALRSGFRQPPARSRPQLLNVLVELVKPAPEQLAQLDRGQRYALFAERTRQQRAELEMWLDAAELDDQVLSIHEIEALGLLLVQCTPNVVERLADAPVVATVAVIGNVAFAATPAA
jgi:hypothetical protein